MRTDTRSVPTSGCFFAWNRRKEVVLALRKKAVGSLRKNGVDFLKFGVDFLKKVNAKFSSQEILHSSLRKILHLGICLLFFHNNVTKRATYSLYRQMTKAEEFNKTIVPMRDSLLRQAMRLSGHDGQTAEDLVQETLIRLWELRDELPRHRNVAAWASTILRNKWNDHWRRSQHTVNDDPLLQRLQDRTADPPDDMELINLIVDHLPPLQQLIFRLKEIEGYEKEEIMLVTGCSDESLRQNLSRARRRIREQFAKLRDL